MYTYSETSGLRDHLEKLYTFCIIAKVGSLSQACRHLESSQAALSHSVKVLETALNVSLFHRTPRGVSLTEPGKVLYEFSKKLMLEMDSVEERLKNPDQEFRGKLHLGTQAVLSAHFWPPALQALAKSYPEIGVNLACGKVEDLIQSLLSRELHAIVTTEPVAHEGLKIIPLYETEFKLYASPEWVKGTISLEDAKKMRIFGDSIAHRDYFLPAMRTLAAAGVLPEQSFEVNNQQTVIQMATHGLGLGFLPEDSVRELVKNKQLIPVQIASVPSSFGKLKVCLTMHEDSADEKLVKALTETLQKQTQDKEELFRLLKA